MWTEPTYITQWTERIQEDTDWLIYWSHIDLSKILLAQNSKWPQQISRDCCSNNSLIGHKISVFIHTFTPTVIFIRAIQQHKDKSVLLLQCKGELHWSPVTSPHSPSRSNRIPIVTCCAFASSLKCFFWSRSDIPTIFPFSIERLSYLVKAKERLLFLINWGSG